MSKWYVMSDGTEIRTRSSFSDKFRRDLKAIGRRAHTHMRVGRFSVVTLQGGGLVIRESWNALRDPGGDISPDSEFWGAHKRDRLYQLDWVATRLDGHPLADEVRLDIEAEREHLSRAP